jgi:hypothetical protein
MFLNSALYVGKNIKLETQQSCLFWLVNSIYLLVVVKVLAKSEEEKCICNAGRLR